LSTSDSEALALLRLVANWVFIDCDCVTSSARAAAIGSSAAVRLRLLVDSCIWVLAIWLCSVFNWVVPVLKVALVLMRMAMV
jgi:hypothetical protein